MANSTRDLQDLGDMLRHIAGRLYAELRENGVPAEAALNHLLLFGPISGEPPTLLYYRDAAGCVWQISASAAPRGNPLELKYPTAAERKEQLHAPSA